MSNLKFSGTDNIDLLIKYLEIYIDNPALKTWRLLYKNINTDRETRERIHIWCRLSMVSYPIRDFCAGHCTFRVDGDDLGDCMILHSTRKDGKDSADECYKLHKAELLVASLELLEILRCIRSSKC